MRLFAALFALLTGSLLGICVTVAAVCIGPFALQYNLNHWIPVLHGMFPVIKNIAPVSMSIPLFLVGVFFTPGALPFAIFTWLIVTLGLIA